MRRPYIDFMGNRKWLFLASAIILSVSIGAMLVRGLQFGIEFQGGTIINVESAPGVSIEQMRASLRANGVEQAEIQSIGDDGYIIRADESDVEKASAVAQAVASGLKIEREDINVTTIGPGWGRNITDSAILALTLAIGAILLYISVRFEYKMSVTAVIALVHDVLITLGIYSLVGREISPNTVAALLTILGYSLYDTIVVFHRIRENSQRIAKQTFMRMANDSINQVLVRSVNTSLTSLIPVVALLVLGGETLTDFAFALTIGMLSGAYSSVAVASPIYAMWKEREPKYRALARRYGNIP